MKTILFIDSVHPKVDSTLLNLGFHTVHDYKSSREELMLKVSGINGIIIRSRFKIDQEFLDACPQLEFIARYGAGLENIDVEAAESRNVHCIRVPEGNKDAVGEHALGMLLMLFNNLKRADLEVRSGVWKREENRGYELYGKTVGIIGYGVMGQGFGEKLKGFGCRTIAYDKYKRGFASNDVEEVGLDIIFEETDILSIHVPLTSETRMMINADFIQKFKKPIYLINTARGPIVDTESLLHGINSGRILGACLDVLEFENTSFENLFENDEFPQAFKDLVASEKVILSPHIAGWSFESFEKLADYTLEKIQVFYRDKS